MSYSSQYSHFNRKSARQTRWKKFLIIGTLLLVAAILFFGFREFRNHPIWTQNIAEYVGRAKTWVMERKQHLNQTVANVKKQVGEGDASERVVNFEFYNTLQEMKSMQVDVAAKVNKNMATAATKTKKPIKIIQAADLEKDLLSAMKQPRGGR